MPEPFPQPSPDEPPSTGIQPDKPKLSAPRPGRGLLLVVAAVAMLVGALAATTVILVASRGGEHQYDVNVYLAHDVTAEQKAEIESALHALQPVRMRFESREQAWQHFEELFKDEADILAQVSAAAMPESFRLTTKGREFDCGRLVPVRQLPGVEKIQVIQRPTKERAGAIVGCG